MWIEIFLLKETATRPRPSTKPELFYRHVIKWFLTQEPQAGLNILNNTFLLYPTVESETHAVWIVLKE